jgi:hypothetical protein
MAKAQLLALRIGIGERQRDGKRRERGYSLEMHGLSPTNCRSSMLPGLLSPGNGMPVEVTLEHDRSIETITFCILFVNA